jgi:BirA family biotin operon repressor/biotin-[acetyl-CoA-carboxylase] ligase
VEVSHQLQERGSGGPGSHHAGAWGTQVLWEALHPLLPGLSIEVVDRLPSTNATLVDRLREASRGARDAHGRGLRADDLGATLLVAIEQTQGRGRLGRNWLAGADTSLTFSLSMPMERADWSGLSLAVGVALAGALDPSGSHIGLKWPNDLWLRQSGGRKLGGILIEAIGLGDHRMAVIGIGLNVLPLHLAEPVASLSEIDPQTTPPTALAKVMPALARALLRFEREGFAGFESAYADRDLLRGHPVVTTDAACPSGVALGVDADGALRVRDASGAARRVVGGEVSVRPAPDAG